MITQEICDNWHLWIDGEGEAVPAAVPGSVYGDLLRAGRLEDPFYRDNEMQALALMEHDFVYRTTFDAQDDILNSNKVCLRCEGLDTLAELYLNGKFAGRGENMHRTYEFSVKELLKAKGNVLEIRFASPTKYIEACYEQSETNGSAECMRGFPQIRKAHCMFGWDWGPRLPDAGIWKPISLLGIQKARFESVYIRQTREDGNVHLKFEIKTDQCGENDTCEKREAMKYRVSIESPMGEVTVLEDSPKECLISEPMLWWPHGYGEQNLYKIRMELLCNDCLEDVWEKRIGLRTMTIHQEKDIYGESFAHEVNGVQIFAMGADYIPEDNILGRVNRERTRKLLEDCIAANFNCIRVWGGGYYPSDDFYDICDELGLLVWQDCMFACCLYDLTEDFDENIRAELRDNIRRIRHHASLGLWCGNNEIEMLVERGEYRFTPRQKADAIKIFEYIIPQVMKEEDPDTFYWPSSPSSGGGYDEPNGPDRGDTHYWDVWHGNKPFTEYRKFFFRYLSEFGFQSFPLEKTIEEFTLPKDRNIFSYIMEKHQRNGAANGKIMNYMYQTYLYPTSFSVLLYASQLLQADAIKYGVEHFRRNRGRCMGAIYWQLNDCWPVASWASIDYFGRWKALHYYAKRFFAPILLSCAEEGVLTQGANVNEQPFPLKKSIHFNVSNETREDRELRIVWSLRKNDGSVKREEEETVTVPALASVWTEEILLPDMEIRKEYISYALYDGQELLSSSSLILSVPKQFEYLDPELSCRVEGDELVVSACVYAKSVEILNDREDMILSDNYFDMDGEEKRVKIISGQPEGIKLRSVYDIR